MAITTEAGYISAKASGKVFSLYRASIANTAVGQIASLYRAVGIPTQPAIPAAHVLCDRATAGAINLPLVAGANSRYIDEFVANNSVIGNVHYVDRIIHGGNLNGTLITAQTVNTPSLPARAFAENCEWFIEHYTDTGATAANATIAATFTDTTTANIVVSLAATRRAATMTQIIAPTGKVIASIQSATLSISTGTAGAFGITCLQRIGLSGVIAIAGIADKGASMALNIPVDSCLNLIQDCTTTSTGNMSGHHKFIEG